MFALKETRSNIGIACPILFAQNDHMLFIWKVHLRDPHIILGLNLLNEK